MEISATGYAAIAHGGKKKKAEEMEDPVETCLPQYFDGRKKGVPQKDLESHCVQILNNSGLYCCLNHWFLNGRTSTFEDVITTEEIHYGEGGYFVKEDNGQKTPVQVAITYPGLHRWKLESLKEQIKRRGWKDQYNGPIDFYLVVTSAKRTQSDSGTGLPSVTDNQDSRGTYTFEGTIKHQNGDYLEGKFENLHAENGTGEAIFDSELCTFAAGNGILYKGEWKRGQFHGVGTCHYPTGTIYYGQWLDGSKHGKGTLELASGNKYIGDFKNNKYDGKGTFIYSNGGKYIGDFEDNDFNGEGTRFFVDGGIYKGRFLNGNRDGEGTMRFNDGGVYKGQWLDDKMNGEGFWVSSEGVVCEGQFVNNKVHGEGTMIYSDRSIYEGQWRHGNTHGVGTMTYPDARDVLQTSSDDQDDSNL